MIYLDYAATTPACEEALQAFYNVSKSYIGNPNSSHKLGREAKAYLDLCTKNIADRLGVKESEIIYTSGATEANNLAIKGIANSYKRYGKHIISTYLEHSSVTGPLTTLQNSGYEIDYVDILDNGLVDLDHLKELLRDDTILVSIGYVDSELGIEQNIHQIGEILASYPHCFFHVDVTQAIGKIPVSLENVDLATFTPHKFYGLHGCGVLVKKDNIMIEPLIHGGVSTTPFRSGTPTLALVAALEKALSLATSDLEERYNYVKQLNKTLKEKLQQYKNVRINSTDKAVPHIVNISIKGANTMAFQSELEDYDIYVSTKSACCAPNTPSRAVYAITKDRKLALSTLRISLSHHTTEKDIETFLEYFDQCYKKLVK
ncbi:MAG: cysteine desulfurase [Epulopiscium sp.]|nr:cysteine desulfurase [Candidatus Epulonipiscium sp.]